MTSKISSSQWFTRSPSQGPRGNSKNLRVTHGGNGVGGRSGCCKVSCIPPCSFGVCVQRTLSLKPNSKYEPSGAKFEGLTTYKENYYQKCIEPTKSYKPAATFVPTEFPLEGLSTYQQAFFCKPLPPKEKPRWAIKNSYEPSDAKMEGVTQYKNDFKGCMVPRTKSFKPHKTFQPSGAKLEGITTYQKDFIPFHFENCESSCMGSHMFTSPIIFGCCGDGDKV